MFERNSGKILTKFPQNLLLLISEQCKFILINQSHSIIVQCSFLCKSMDNLRSKTAFSLSICHFSNYLMPCHIIIDWYDLCPYSLISLVCYDPKMVYIAGLSVEKSSICQGLSFLLLHVRERYCLFESVTACLRALSPYQSKVTTE